MKQSALEQLRQTITSQNMTYRKVKELIGGIKLNKAQIKELGWKARFDEEGNYMPSLSTITRMCQGNKFSMHDFVVSKILSNASKVKLIKSFNSSDVEFFVDAPIDEPGKGKGFIGSHTKSKKCSKNSGSIKDLMKVANAGKVEKKIPSTTDASFFSDKVTQPTDVYESETDVETRLPKRNSNNTLSIGKVERKKETISSKKGKVEVAFKNRFKHQQVSDMELTDFVNGQIVKHDITAKEVLATLEVCMEFNTTHVVKNKYQEADSHFNA